MTKPTRVFPPMLAFEVSREAVVLYAYALASADETGLCAAVYCAGGEGNLNREQMDTALEELIRMGYAEEHVEQVPIAEFRGGGVVYGSRIGCRIVHFDVPLQLGRLSPEIWGRLRQSIFKRDDFTCQYCGDRGGLLECDHVEPVSKGGTNEPGNLITACSTCNKSKRSKLISEWRIREGT